MTQKSKRSTVLLSVRRHALRSPVLQFQLSELVQLLLRLYALCAIEESTQIAADDQCGRGRIHKVLIVQQHELSKLLLIFGGMDDDNLVGLRIHGRRRPLCVIAQHNDVPERGQ